LQRLVGHPQLNGGYKVRTCGLGVDMGSIGLKEVKGFEAPGASEPDFTSVTVP
jgi:hypothetical protein